ncbi:MAG: PSD1 and planctomycete cytochrome C domain-containing protein, partial [Rubripirellula sp.]
LRLGIAAATALLCCAKVSAEPASPSDTEQMRFFESRVRPLLVARCYECHSKDTAEGGLRLDVAGALLKGGDSGPSVTPGEPASSLLISAIRYEELEMPPDEPLPPAEQKVLETWIQQGAFWPVTETDAEAIEDQPPWWAALPIDPGTVPAAAADVVSRDPIDRYIDRKLEDAGLYRAPTADRRRLIRRLSYDLRGLPPSPEEIAQFVQDERPNAYVRLVDRLFADPAYGERMARLWLDLVRYAESDGWRADAYRPQAWRYRQFVADAFNAGMTYDQFVRLQLAGDEVDPGNDEALAAAGLLRLGIYEFNQRDAEGQWQNVVDEITDVTADIFLATGLACAKCHDHKFDPIPRSDYFRLRSVFEPILFVDRQPIAGSSHPSTEVRALLEELGDIEGTGIQELGDFAVDRFPLNVQAMFRKTPDERSTYEHQIAYLVGRQIIDEGLAGTKVEKKIGKERHEQRQAVLKKLDAFDANPYSVPDLMTVRDAQGDIRPTRLPGRSKGKSFEPGAPKLFGGEVFPPRPDASSRTSGRRTALANWITSPDNPISSRVMVNRLWQYHFGTGLVSSPNDFGRLGTQPSHPRLLDYLAKRFIDNGWNLQAIQREIVCSETYQQSANHPQHATALEIDASNRLHWHRTVRRLDAEQYRDSLLVAMQSLQNRYGGPSVAGTPGRRSIYLQRRRNSADEMLNTLDAPTGLVGTAKRDVTTTAPQSLMMMNSPRILGVAKKFASRVREDVASVPEADRNAAFVIHAHEIIAGLPPDDAIVALLEPMIRSGSQGEIDVCHILINSNAFLFID